MLKYFLLHTSSPVLTDILSDASDVEAFFTSLPSFTLVSALCTFPGIHQS